MSFADEDLKIMDSIISRYPRSRSAIMPLLHYVQYKSGYVTNDGIELISQKLGIEAAEVSAVATFTFGRLRAERAANSLSSSRITRTFESMLKAARTFANSAVFGAVNSREFTATNLLSATFSE